jgi:hypothetical protein
MYTREEILDELRQFDKDYSDEGEREGIIADFIEQTQEEANRQGYADKARVAEWTSQTVATDVAPSVDTFEFSIKVHEAMSCAHNDVLIKFIPEGNIEKFLIKMTPHVVKYLLEDFNITEKDAQ